MSRIALIALAMQLYTFSSAQAQLGEYYFPTAGSANTATLSTYDPGITLGILSTTGGTSGFSVPSLHGMQVNFGSVIIPVEDTSGLIFTINASPNVRFDSISSVTFYNPSIDPSNVPGVDFNLYYRNISQGGGFTSYQNQVSISGGASPVLTFTGSIGSLQFGSDIEFKLIKLNGEIDNFKFGNQDNLSTTPAIGIYGSATVNAVPEPGSMILTGLALAGAGGGAFWRRRKSRLSDTVQEDQG